MKCYKCYCAPIVLRYSELRVHIPRFLVLPKCYRKCYWKKSVIFPKMALTFLKTAATFSKKSPPFSEISFAFFSMSHFAPETA